jgi:phosphoesterase RecJ-like protein
MAAVLETLGKQTRIVNGDAVPRHLEFIDPQRKVLVLGDTVAADALSAVDVVIILDTSAWVQLGPMAAVVRRSSARKVVVDHHVGQDDLDAELFKNPACESTGRLVVEAAEALGVALTPTIAIPLFAAMATDTGWFRFSSVDGQTLRVAGCLIDAGARPAALYADLYEQSSLARLQLRGRLLAATKSYRDGRLVATYATRHDFAVTGALPEDTEDVVNLLLGVAGSQVAVLLQEQADGRVKASLRSHAEVDVRRIAESFGGGGHTAAAGVLLDGPLQQAEARLLDALGAALTAAS